MSDCRAPGECSCWGCIQAENDQAVSTEEEVPDGGSI